MNSTITNPEFIGGPFAAAVREAVFCDSDNWEINYYRNQGKWPDNRLKTFMHTRNSALGPEWRELQKCITAMKNAEHTSRLEQLKMDVEHEYWLYRSRVKP